MLPVTRHEGTSAPAPSRALFSWYAANFGNFNKTYGSLGAIIGFMTWMWLSIIVVLVGAKLNAELEHQTTRAAEMADTSGPS